MEVFGKGSCRGEPLLLSLIVMAAIGELGFNDVTGLVAFDFFTSVLLLTHHYNTPRQELQ